MSELEKYLDEYYEKRTQIKAPDKNLFEPHCYVIPRNILCVMEKMFQEISELKMKTGNVVIAGDYIYASIDADVGGVFSDPLTEIENGMVIEFENAEEFGKALRSGTANFTVFAIKEDCPNVRI